MTIRTKQIIIALLSTAFIISLIFVQWTEVTRREQESGRGVKHVAIPSSSQACVNCHQQSSPGIIDHWTGSTHAVKGVGCVECHQAEKHDADAFDHYGIHGSVGRLGATHGRLSLSERVLHIAARFASRRRRCV